ncbi:hypothetical protein [Alkalisalibacterium limincola]|uniref:TolC family protein n=1 Tax=Alkalisalibacterium limincola TaxID=2699169 RepID=A0A5C8KVX4_9GAMM|nr:hypothetical protein [Alkalisalibacterium limincola]TXK64490.1 hypothetical protein FU658_06270 [Alkalisalibacterium limincola]
MTKPLYRALGLAALLPALVACASFSPQRAGEQALELAAVPIGPAASENEASTAEQRQALLMLPLEREHAVSLALAGNPDLKIAWSRLGIGAAEAFVRS